jgi:hypothetical protein
MKIVKRVFLFMSVNILIIATLSIVMSMLGVQPYLNAKGIHFSRPIKSHGKVDDGSKTHRPILNCRSQFYDLPFY